MLSSVSKIADKAFVIGFLLPALIFDIAIYSRFGCPPTLNSVCHSLQSNDNPFANLTYFVLIVWVEAVLLLALNNGIYRFFEGYPYKTWFFEWPLNFQKGRFRSLWAEYTKLKNDGKKTEADTIKRDLLFAFPYNEAAPLEEKFILPTAFGNRIRAFELYSKNLYGADAIRFWWRMSSVIPAASKAEIADARSQVDFFMNLSLLAWIFTAVAIIRITAILGGQHVFWADDANRFLVAAVGSALIATWTYYRACAAIVPWGSTVMAAFDCYLPSLAEKLGYRLPDAASERFAFWQNLSKLFIYRRAKKLAKLPWLGVSPSEGGKKEPVAEGGEEKNGGQDDGDDEED